MRLEGKVAIVSGGGTGIGAAAARMFAKEGAKVVVTGRRPEPLEEVAAETGGLAVAGDTADDAHVRAVVATAVEAFGGLDVVVANAGLGFGGAAAEVDDERWQRTLDVNLTGAFRLARAAIPPLIERGGGSIVRVSSVTGIGTGTESAAYGTSKAAMHGLARSLAVDYGPNGIRANAICPAAMPYTNFAAAGGMEAPAGGIEEMAEHVGAMHPLGRPITAEDCAEAAVYLVSDRAANITGVLFPVDGGYVAR